MTTQQLEQAPVVSKGKAKGESPGLAQLGIEAVRRAAHELGYELLSRPRPEAVKLTLAGQSEEAVRLGLAGLKAVVGQAGKYYQPAPTLEFSVAPVKGENGLFIVSGTLSVCVGDTTRTREQLPPSLHRYERASNPRFSMPKSTSLVTLTVSYDKVQVTLPSGYQHAKAVLSRSIEVIDLGNNLFSDILGSFIYWQSDPGQSGQDEYEFIARGIVDIQRIK